MEINVVDKGECIKEMEIVVPQEEVKKKLEEAYNNIKKEAFVPGFRKGKVPLPLLKIRFGKVVEGEVKRDIMREYYQKAIVKERLRPVTDPSFEEIEFSEDKPFKFKATVEVIPPVELCDYDKVEVEREKIEVTDEDVEAVIEAKREELSEFRSVNRPCMKGDRVVVDVVIESDGKVLQTARDLTFNLGEGILPKEVEEKITGLKKGELKKVKVEEEGLDYEVKIKDVMEKRLIALDEEFLENLGGVKSLDELKNEIREGLENLARRKEERILEERILQELIEKSNIQVPPSIVNRLIKYYNVGIDKVEGEEAKERALNDIKRELVIDEVARREKISVSDEEVEELRKKIMEEGTPEEKRMWLPEERKEDLKRRILRSKVLDFLKKKVKVKEKRKVILTPEEAYKMGKTREVWRRKGKIIVPGG